MYAVPCAVVSSIHSCLLLSNIRLQLVAGDVPPRLLSVLPCELEPPLIWSFLLGTSSASQPAVHSTGLR